MYHFNKLIKIKRLKNLMGIIIKVEVVVKIKVKNRIWIN
jgi:hypothetical protein